MITFFDSILVCLIIAGGIWGYVNGGSKILVKLAFIIAPGISLAYFGSDMATISTTLAAMLKDRISAPLGLVGAGSALIGMVGLVGSFFIGSRIFIALIDLHDPGPREKIGGAVIAVLGIFAILAPVFIFFAKTFPAPAQNMVASAITWPYVRPGLIAVYDPIDDFIDRRMAGLANGLSDNRMIAHMAAGRSPSAESVFHNVVQKMRDIDFQEVLRLQKAARALDPKEVEKLLTAYKSGDMSRDRLKSHLENPELQAVQ